MFYTIAYLCLVPAGFKYGYYHDVYTMETSPSGYHARLGSMMPRLHDTTCCRTGVTTG